LGRPMPGASVKLYAMVKPNVVADVKADGITDNDGRVTFLFKLPAIFDVKATKGDYTAKSLIKLEAGKTSEKEVILR